MKESPEISPFPTVFSKDLYCRQAKNKGLFGKGLMQCQEQRKMFF